MTKPATVTELDTRAAEAAEAAPLVEAPRRKSVQEAIAAVMSELPNIGKGDKSPEGYQYRGIEAITKHVQPLFAKHGVVIVPQARVISVMPSPAMKDGWQDVHVEVGWTIVGPDGSSLEAVTSGIGRDRSDKGSNKGQTQAYKYLLLHLLCIADGKDDSDNQSYEHDRAPEPVEWNANMAKAHLLSLCLGSKDKAAEVWKAIDGDSWQKWSAASVEAEFDQWLAQQDAEPEDGES